MGEKNDRKTQRTSTRSRRGKISFIPGQIWPAVSKSSRRSIWKRRCGERIKSQAAWLEYVGRLRQALRWPGPRRERDSSALYLFWPIRGPRHYVRSDEFAHETGRSG